MKRAPYKPRATAERRRMEQLRRACFERDNWRCRDCTDPVTWGGELWERGHMHHSKTRGAGGPDSLANVVTLCSRCHEKRHNAGGKPCPSKPKEVSRG